MAKAKHPDALCCGTPDPSPAFSAGSGVLALANQNPRVQAKTALDPVCSQGCPGFRALTHQDRAGSSFLALTDWEAKHASAAQPAGTTPLFALRAARTPVGPLKSLYLVWPVTHPLGPT